MLESYLKSLFLLNTIFIICDATIGYHVAPLLTRMGMHDDEEHLHAVKCVRSMLSIVVALYMFFNCYALFRAKVMLLYIITAIVVVDILAQTVVRWKMTSKRDD